MKFSDIKSFIKKGSYEVNISLSYLEKWIKEQESSKLQFNPDFQRGHVWTEKQQIDFMEYFLRGGTSGMVIYFNNPSWNSYAETSYNDFVCVDGLQRITAVRKFMNNKLKVFGILYDDFEDSIIMCRSKDSLRLNINQLQTKKEVLEWYVQMNSGGTPHTDEEIDKVKNMIKGDQ